MARVHVPSSPQSSNRSSASDLAPPSIPLPAFLRQNRSDVHGKFIDLEWQQRERLHQGPQTQTDGTAPKFLRVSGDDVVKRNRYMNVDPFVDNRIRLKVPDGHSDYINASPIRLPSKRKDKERYFIATQGPKEGSHNHIWRMIWHETADPAVVVMLTQTYESGREKCFQYFPESMEHPVLDVNEQDEFEDDFLASLRLLSVKDDPKTRSSIRELELKTADGRTKKVWHLLFAGWPDFLIPEGEDRSALVNLIELSHEKNDHPKSPPIVHCSAGVGRSGTFIALDWLLAELEEGNFDSMSDDEDPILDLVDLLRQQRMMMVQGEQQYFFLYDVLREKWIGRWKARQAGHASPAANGAATPVTSDSINDQQSKNGGGETATVPAAAAGTSSGGASTTTPTPERTAVSPARPAAIEELNPPQDSQRRALELEMRGNVEQTFR